MTSSPNGKTLPSRWDVSEDGVSWDVQSLLTLKNVSSLWHYSV